MKVKYYFSIFLITAATLMFEILLTRIFSVTMWYHYAFVAISVAMFGMTEGALMVQLLSNFFKEEKTILHITLASLLFSVTMNLSYFTYLSIPFISTNQSLIGLFSIALIFFVISIPFIFSGIAVCLFLTRYPLLIKKLYAADLAGAAIGCVGLILLLNSADASSSVLIISLLPAIGAILLSNRRKITFITSILMFLTLILAASNIYLFNSNNPLINIIWVKGEIEKKPLYQHWNSFSRIKVDGDSSKSEKPFGWGLSGILPDSLKIRQLKLDIDANAATFLTRFDGSMDSISFLKYDITNVVHEIRTNSDIFIVGSGAGRDVLSSLYFRQKSITAVELNKDIINTTNDRFGNFTGNLAKYPQVKFVADEARSYLSGSSQNFDIIQLSLIDTWAATASGGFVLSENSLYTVEAFNTFFKHLNSDGILSISRWYFRDKSTEIYRLVSLAYKSLINLGIKNPGNHIMILRNMQTSIHPDEIPDGVGTVLICKKPFTVEEINKMKQISAGLEFELVYYPGHSSDETFLSILNNYGKTIGDYPLNISAPTDDSPFFFHSLKLSKIFNDWNWKHNEMTINMKAMYVLGSLLLVVSVLTVLFIILPLLFGRKQRTELRYSFGFISYFALLGLGFMFVELSLMQRLILFLGHPVYSLSVVLFSLLLSSGAGSYLSDFFSGTNKQILFTSLLMIFILLIFGIITPVVIGSNETASISTRIIISIILIAPAGLLMGTAFPNGMKLASINNKHVTPWFWGINGATSIFASVSSVALGLTFGINATFWAGFACYVIGVFIILRKL